MADITTDTHTLMVTIVAHGNVSVGNVVAPPQVFTGDAFVITYDAVNNGGTDACYGKLIDNADSSIIDEWEETIESTMTKSVTINHAGITANLDATIEVGYRTL